MKFFEYFKLSLNALRTNKVRSLLTMLGIIIGVASVILLVSIGSGLQAFVTGQFQSLGSNVIFVLPGKVDLKNGGGRPTVQVSKFESADVTAINRIGSPIKQASPLTQVNAIIRYKGKSTSIVIQGVWENFFGIRNLNPELGKVITQNDVERSRKNIVLGSKVVTDLFGEGANPINKVVTLSDIRYTVTGTLESKGGGGLGVDMDNQAYIPLSTALRQFNQQNPYMLFVETTDEKRIDEASDKIKQALLKRLNEDDFTVVQQTELLSTITQFLGAITVALGGIAAISLLVGGIGIMNIMLVSVTERTREIGLRKAIGATRTEVLLQFLIESIILSVIGGIIGILIGGAGALLLRQFIQTAVTPWSVLISFGFSAIIGIVFGVAPAIRAARLDPIEALRYE